MKSIKKVCAGFMLSLGFICLMVSVSTLLELNVQNITPEQRQEATDALLGGIAFGVPLTVGGGYMFWGLRRRHQKELSDRLDSITLFFMKFCKLIMVQ